MDLTFEHVAPTWAILTGLGLAVVIALLSLWRHLGLRWANGFLLACRVLFFVLLGWCLLLPARQRTQTELIKPRFIVALDTSASMWQAPPRGVRANRWAVAREVLSQPWTRRLGAQCTIDVFAFDSELHPPLTLEWVPSTAPQGKATLLREALRKIADRYKGQAVTGMLVLSDGLDTREMRPEWTGEDWPFPLYTVRLEPPDVWVTEPDVRIAAADTPRRAVVDWDTKLTATLAGQGIRGRPFDVQLLENGALLESLAAQLPDEGGTQDIAFRLPHPRIGTFTYTVAIPPLPGETRTNDNAFSVNVQVVDARNRLLYAESVPRWESKYLARELRANKTVTPMIFIRGPDGKFLSYGERAGMTLDMTDEQLSLFKTVILGDLDAQAIGPARAAALVKFVGNGGSLVLLGGPAAWGPGGFAATPLKQVIPFDRPGHPPASEGPFAVVLSDEGRAHALFTAQTNAWDALPPVLSVFAGAKPSFAATVLLEVRSTAGAQPLLITQKYGEGKVVAILTDSFWRWQLTPGQARPYAQFWRQLLEWFSPPETTLEKYDLDLFADTGVLAVGENIALKARFSGQDREPPASPGVVCEVQTPDNRRIPLTLSRQDVNLSGRRYTGYGIEFAPQTPGLHRAVARVEIEGRQIESAPYSFYVQPFTPENRPQPVNVPVLQGLAESSRGKFLEPGAVNAVLAGLRADARQESRVEYATLWQHWRVLACLMGLLFLEWISRKVRGMA